VPGARRVHAHGSCSNAKVSMHRAFIVCTTIIVLLLTAAPVLAQKA
jgi:hypothetical protein